MTEEELLAFDRALNEQKNDGRYDRVAASAALHLDHQHGIGLL